MTAKQHTRNKQALAPFCAALYDYDPGRLAAAVRDVFAPDCGVHLAHPIEDVDGPEALCGEVYAGLAAAVPDLERRDTIVIAGPALGAYGTYGPDGEGGEDGAEMAGCCGYYTGVFSEPWLGIPPTHRQITMRFHEFFRFQEGRIVEMQALWDIPELMMQAGVWPMGPSLGLEWHVPGPATQDGVSPGPCDPQEGAVSAALVGDMLAALKRSPEGVEAMQLDRYWHPQMNWYGPAGVGTNRRIAGFRRAHQIPFLNAMPDRGRHSGAPCYLFGDGAYTGFTAWPGMDMTLSGAGWLGIPPVNKKMTMRSLDFWRCENGMIRENWVLIDLLHVYDQLGVDVFARMRELTPEYRNPWR